MPKAAQHILRWSPEHQAYILSEQEKGSYVLLQAEEAWWFGWLATHTSFSFQGQHGHFTIHKEVRPRGGEGYWYAYQRQGKRLAKHYVGRTTDLVLAHLEEIALAFTHQAEQLQTIALPHQGIALRPEPLLVSKLSPPRLSPLLVLRQRLFSRLDAGVERTLTLLSAPAGYGKTTLARQWMADREMRSLLPPVAWVSLDAGDNDPVRFWRYVMTACQIFGPACGQSALTSLTSVAPPLFGSSPGETALRMFLNELASLEQQGILILDDYHAITEYSIHESVTFLVEHLPATLHVMILTRPDPPLPLARLRARHQLQELRAPDLSLSLEEMGTFFRHLLEHPPSAETIMRLNTHLEGWAAGLRLVTLTLSPQATQEEVTTRLTTVAGSHRTLVEYFVAEVLSVQPEPLQHFLLLTSVLGRLTGSLCDAVTQREESAHLLDQLVRTGLFLEALDEAGQWYRYHPLFAEAMRTEASRRLTQDVLLSIFSRASGWFEHHGMLVEAVEAALSSQDMERSIRLMERIIESQPFQVINEFHTLRRWLEQVPEGLLRHHPVLCLNYVMVLLASATSDHFPVAQLSHVERLLLMAEQGWQMAGNQPKLGEVFALRCLVAWKQEEVAQAVRAAEQALAWLPTSELTWRSVALGILGQRELLRGQLTVAQTTLLEVSRLGEASGNRTLLRVATNMLAKVSSGLGELHQAAECYRQVLREAREQEDLDDVSHALLGLARLAYEWNELETAEQHAREALALGRHLAHEAHQVHASVLLARVYAARGQPIAARRLLDARLSALQLHRTPLLSREVLAEQVRLDILNGDLMAAQQWAQKHAHSVHEELPADLAEHEERLMARLLLKQGRMEEARARLDGVRSAARSAGRAHSVLETQVLMALASACGKRGNEAKRLLQEMLSHAALQGYQRLFLDEGEAMATLLRLLSPGVRDLSLRTYLQTLLRSFAQVQPDQQSTASEASPPLLEPLSAQEQRVLRLLVAGRSNREIAGELVVSINTIRTQVQSIYRKLLVKNRVEASEVARLLRLL
jgi:LuxR family transcriptional regulator, maltose regulon positive regulatory protein